MLTSVYKVVFLLLLVSLVVSFAGCGSDEDTKVKTEINNSESDIKATTTESLEESTTSTISVESTSTTSVPVTTTIVKESQPGEVSKETMGDSWPLTVDTGILSCEGNAVLFTNNGQRYSVNGTAKGRYPDLPDIFTIAADNPDIPGTKKSIDSLLSTGLLLCA